MSQIDPIKFVALIGFIYRLLLRGIIKHAIADPDTEWDDAVLSLLDKVFGYEGKDDTNDQ